MSLYPINLNINNRRCLVVGGGEVAGRKVRSLVNCGASVVVISPQVCRKITELVEDGDIEWVARTYRRGDVEGAFLVFAATDVSEVQKQVVEEANDLEILVNIVDAPGSCSFHVPARMRRGDFLVTVSTGGGSPALAAQIRRELEQKFGPEYQIYVDLLSNIREKIVGDGNASESHKILFEKLLQLNILELIRDKDWLMLQQQLRAVLPADIEISELLHPLVVE